MAHHTVTSTRTTTTDGAYASSPSPEDCIEDSPPASDTKFQSLMSVINGLNDSSLAISSALASPSMSNLSTTTFSTVNRSSLNSVSSLFTSSSETAFNESEHGRDSETDVGEDENEEERKNGGTYSYRLLPALAMPSFAPGPSTMDAPWPYTFEKGSTAFARGGNGTWRRVTLLDSGIVSSSPGDDEDAPGPCSLVYTAQWVGTSGQTFRATFCPTLGDLKPDDAHVRRLLAREGSVLHPQH